MVQIGSRLRDEICLLQRDMYSNDHGYNNSNNTCHNESSSSSSRINSSDTQSRRNEHHHEVDEDGNILLYEGTLFRKDKPLSPAIILVKSTDFPRTIQSVQALLVGLFPLLPDVRDNQHNNNDNQQKQ